MHVHHLVLDSAGRDDERTLYFGFSPAEISVPNRHAVLHRLARRRFDLFGLSSNQIALLFSNAAEAQRPLERIVFGFVLRPSLSVCHSDVAAAVNSAHSFGKLHAFLPNSHVHRDRRSIGSFT